MDASSPPRKRLFDVLLAMSDQHNNMLEHRNLVDRLVVQYRSLMDEYQSISDDLVAVPPPPKKVCRSPSVFVECSRDSRNAPDLFIGESEEQTMLDETVKVESTFVTPELKRLTTAVSPISSSPVPRRLVQSKLPLVPISPVVSPSRPHLCLSCDAKMPPDSNWARCYTCKKFKDLQDKKAAVLLSNGVVEFNCNSNK